MKIGLRTLLVFIGSLAWLHSCGTRSYLSDRLKQGAVFSSADFTVPDPNHFSFAIVGDLHIGDRNTSRLDRILSDAKAEGDEFVILLGDTVDRGEEADFIAVNNSIVRGGFQGRFFPVVGNHDVFENGWEYFSQHFGSSRYSFVVGNSKFIVLDTADATVGEGQVEWLKTEMNSNTSQNVFLASHYLPMIPDIRTYLKLSNDREALRLMAWSDDAGVRAWLGAHYHSYVIGKIGSVDYVVAGGGGGRRMEPVLNFFFVQVTVDGTNVTYTRRDVP